MPYPPLSFFALEAQTFQIFGIFLRDLVVSVTGDKVYDDGVHVGELGDGGGEAPLRHFGMALDFMGLGHFR